MIDVASSDAGNFDSVAVAGSATLDGSIQINAGTFVPGPSDPDLFSLLRQPSLVSSPQLTQTSIP